MSDPTPRTRRGDGFGDAPAQAAPLVVVGDALLDRDLSGTADRLAPDAPVPVVDGCEERLRPGGAALAAYLAALGGREVTLVAAVGGDAASARLLELLAPWVTVLPLTLSGALPEKTRVVSGGRIMLRLDRGEGRACGVTAEARRAVAGAGAVLVSDYGRGAAEVLRGALEERAARAPVVWDPHPRGGPPVAGARLVTPTAGEARHFARVPDAPAGAGSGLAAVMSRAAWLVREWRAGAVAVTLGADGALLSYGDHPLLVPAPARHGGDSCGAGDQFAASAAGLLADGALPEQAVRGAVAAATGYVASGGAAALASPGRPSAPAAPSPQVPSPEPAGEVIRRVRAAGGTVVAAGGCFDLLHAGHVGMLQAARATGDCLVVCVNSDSSVRRRKGPGRPITPLADRVRVLQALGCVDAVAVFDENTPERLLADLRPDIWVKGGDYARADLPEAGLLERWGGRVVLLPYLDGRSSTQIAARAAVSAGGGVR
ncbi:D-glycero-beta-D-manno-heptose 1-phosphate adenylyltransferase [Streptomyces sp. TRM 70351]|uniref:D-glycero-beta-D-manno-heptose 1-phosphate adenylyltransferase n=1 Tax=Streptomyces sp. TRM 70351 TaxID=3116552 RepID=UPI002E7B971F|nr:D-glycero-beta-D-manno-heptose 1-phosphate adenylyltransferase [Streptomyces sp. TRM 70351]MEE1927017.1 D-glycero-beta-D-manno-heptose 1-phosphate adenylyltransferase [Streptomyces sp. TRM 70351]